MEVDDLIQTLSLTIDANLRDNLQKALRTLRLAAFPEGALDVLMRPALLLLDLVYAARGRHPPSDNLFARIEDLKQQGTLPD